MVDDFSAVIRAALKAVVQTSIRNVNLVWALLIARTLGGALFGESSNPGFCTAVIVTRILPLKGHMVIDHFLELGSAHRGIRRVVRLYGTLLPLMVIISNVFGPFIAKLTAI